MGWHGGTPAVLDFDEPGSDGARLDVGDGGILPPEPVFRWSAAAFVATAAVPGGRLGFDVREARSRGGVLDPSWLLPRR